MEFQRGLRCSACNPVRQWSEFIEILDRGDVGITIYRYTGPERAEMGRTDERPKETFILYTTREVIDSDGIDRYTAERKCKKYCPTCIEMMRRTETLCRRPPSDRESDLCEIFSCPPCADLAHKFRKFSAEVNLLKREHDSELILLQRLTSPSRDAIGAARTRFEDLVVSGAQDNVPTKQGAKDNELTAKERVKGKDLKTKITKTVKDTERNKKERAKDNELTKKEREKDEDLKTKTTKTVKDTGGKKKERDADNKDLKAESIEAPKSLGKISKDAEKTIKGGDKTTSLLVNSSKVGNIDSKRKSEEKEKIGKTLKSINSKSSTKVASLNEDKNPLIRMKIADHMHQEAKYGKANREHELKVLKQKKDIEDKFNRANKLEEEAKNARARAEEARQLKFKAAMQYDGPEGPGSVDRDTDVCSDETVVDYIIKGNKIVKARAEKQVEKPIAAAVLPSITSRSSVAPAHPPSTLRTDSKTTDHSSKSHPLRDARITYSLSERKYVDKGWTTLPKEMVMRKVTLFLMHPARNEFDWLEMNRHKERVMYESGEQLATFEENGCAKVYYRSGVLALDFYQAQEKNAGGYRVVVYSNGRPVERGRAPLHSVLAAFDYSGNGAVFDHNGRPRLKYSQNDGVVLDRSIGPYTHWKWHNLNDAGRLQTVLVDNEPINKDPEIIRLGEVKEEEGGKRGKKVRKASQADEKSGPGDKSVPLTSRASDKTIFPEIESGEPISNEEMTMRTIEAENVIKHNSRLLKGYSSYQIKMKAFKLNDNFSLRIIDQSSVFLAFSDGKTRLRINVGMVMDPTVVLGEDLVEVGEVTSSLEKVPASESLVELQRVVRGARAAERARVLREKRINKS